MPPVEESLLVARLLFFAGRLGDADRLLRPLVRAHPDRADLLKFWARIKHTQGQLTEAIRTYQRVQALAPSEPSALDTLDLLSRGALQPESTRREVELELTKNEALQRAHKAQLELERAFRLASQHKFTSAVEICDRIAELHKTNDPPLFKLALLEKAVVLEGIGQFDGAIQTLERLGATRGFEGDEDRLKSLARTYERRGSNEDLLRATKVYGFLYEETRAAEFLSRMAKIASRRGEQKEAERLEKLFIDSFLREEQALSFEEVLDGAVLRYVPLAELRALAPDGQEMKRLLDEKRESLGDRKHALLLAIMGEREAAIEIWRRLITDDESRPEDAKYFAETVDEIGDVAGSRALYLAALSSETSADVSLLGKLLAIDDEETKKVVALIFADEDKRKKTYDAVKDAAKAHQLRPEAWHTLARYEALIGMESESARHRQKAEALVRVKNLGGPRIGHVQVAAVYDFQGRKQGLVHEIWASRYRVGAAAGEGGQLDEGSIFGNVASDMMRDIQNVFVAVRTFVEQKFPHLVENLGEYRYVLKVTKDDEPSGGNSAGIAVALAFVSVFLQKSVPQDFAITGSVVADSSSEIRLHRISDVDHKALGVHQRRLSRLIVPAENLADLEASHLIPRQVWESRVSFAKNLTQVMKIVFGDDLWEW